jgi:hypothetical protein
VTLTTGWPKQNAAVILAYFRDVEEPAWTLLARMFLRRLFTQQQPVLRQLRAVTLPISVSATWIRAQRQVLTFQAIYFASIRPRIDFDSALILVSRLQLYLNESLYSSSKCLRTRTTICLSPERMAEVSSFLSPWLITLPFPSRIHTPFT